MRRGIRAVDTAFAVWTIAWLRAAGRDARLTGADAEEAAGTLAIVLGLAVALGPTIPAAFLYLLLRPLVGELRRV